MMGNPAIASDAAARGYVTPAGVTETVVQTRLDEAWRALHFEEGLRALDSLIESEQVDVDLVVDVVWAAAVRVLRNPEGTSDESSALDDYSESWKRADSTQDLYFTAAELRRLRPDSLLGENFAGSFKYA